MAMEIEIKNLDGILCLVNLSDVGNVFQDDNVIYFNGKPYQLSTAKPSDTDEIEYQLDKERLFIRLYLAEGDEANKLLEETFEFDEHPDWYEGACQCQLCCSYGY